MDLSSILNHLFTIFISFYSFLLHLSSFKCTKLCKERSFRDKGNWLQTIAYLQVWLFPYWTQKITENGEITGREPTVKILSCRSLKWFYLYIFKSREWLPSTRLPASHPPVRLLAAGCPLMSTEPSAVYSNCSSSWYSSPSSSLVEISTPTLISSASFAMDCFLVWNDCNQLY